jgi:hypothetical protein
VRANQGGRSDVRNAMLEGRVAVGRDCFDRLQTPTVCADLRVNEVKVASK